MGGGGARAVLVPYILPRWYERLRRPGPLHSHLASIHLMCYWNNILESTPPIPPSSTSKYSLSASALPMQSRLRPDRCWPHLQEASALSNLPPRNQSFGKGESIRHR